MVKGSSNSCAVLVLLAITFVASSDINISYQIGELNNKLTYLQGRLDLFGSVTHGNVSLIQHRVEVNNSKCAENVSVEIQESIRKLEDKIDSHDVKLNALEGKFDGLATAVTNLVGDIKKLLLKPLSSCVDALPGLLLNRGNGIYNIKLDGFSSPFDVYCMPDPKGGLPWTVVQRRVDATVDFNRNWTEYQRGFGDLDNNFFIGLETLHLLTTKSEPQELWVMVTDPDGISAHAYYSLFAIGNEAEKYSLKLLGAYSGNAGDALTYHKSMKFSTFDNDNDKDYLGDCANVHKSAWWFKMCTRCNLNGVYGSGITWYYFHETSVSMRYAHMAIRPARK